MPGVGLGMEHQVGRERRKRQWENSNLEWEKKRVERGEKNRGESGSSLEEEQSIE